MGNPDSNKLGFYVLHQISVLNLGCSCLFEAKDLGDSNAYAASHYKKFCITDLITIFLQGLGCGFSTRIMSRVAILS